jgi:nucleotide-binding universal stress UspA family protein
MTTKERVKEAPIKIASILVPIDDSPCSETAADHAVELARRLGASITLLYAWHPAAELGPILDAASIGGGTASVSLASYLEAEARTFLEIERARLVARGVTIHAKLAASQARQAIVEEARHHDLIVMGTHGRSGIARFVTGSVAAWVVRQSPVPILTLREGAPTIGTGNAHGASS